MATNSKLRRPFGHTDFVETIASFFPLLSFALYIQWDDGLGLSIICSCYGHSHPLNILIFPAVARLLCRFEGCVHCAETK